MNLDEIKKANDLKKAKANAKKGKPQSPPMLPKRPRPWLTEDDTASNNEELDLRSPENISNNQEATTLEPALLEPAYKEPALDELPSKELAEVKPADLGLASVEPANNESASLEPARFEPAEVKPALAEPAAIETAQVKSAELEPAPDRPASSEVTSVESNLDGREVADRTLEGAVREQRSGVAKVGTAASEEDPVDIPSPQQHPSNEVAAPLTETLSNHPMFDNEALVEISTVQDVLLGKLGIRAFPVIRLYCALYDRAMQSKNATVCLIRPDLMKIVGTNSNATVSRAIEKGKTFQFWKVSTIFFQKGDLKPGTYFEVNLNAINSK